MHSTSVRVWAEEQDLPALSLRRQGAEHAADQGLSFDLQPHSALASPLVLLGSLTLQCYPASPSPCQLGMVRTLGWLAERWMCPVVQDEWNCLESSLSGHFLLKAAVCSLYRSRRSLKNWVCHGLRSSGNESWHLDLCLRSATEMLFPRPSLSCSWRSYLNPSLVRAAHELFDEIPS